MRDDSLMAIRARGFRRDGRRTTLRVPQTLMAEAERLAAQLGTSVNDVIVRLAEEGAGRQRASANGRGSRSSAA